MPSPLKTKINPYGLTKKQNFVIQEAIETIKQNKNLNLTKITAKYYNTKYPDEISNQNYHKLNFREALINGLTKRKILGNNSIIEKKLTEGLEAITTTKDNGEQTDYKTRLSYIQEINKIAGLHAPEKIDKRTLNLNIDIPSDELDKRIQQLQQELTV